MATFPALTPAIRTWTPGEYVNAASYGINGKQRNVRLSNTIKGSELQMQFVALTFSELDGFVQHYIGQSGSYVSFGLPAEAWRGVSNANDYLLAGYLWRYAEPPQVEDYAADDQTRFNLSVKLVTVVAEGTSLVGVQLLVRTTLSAGSAGASNGASLAVTVALQPGRAVFVPQGISAVVGVTFQPGWPLFDGALFGLNQTVAVAISPGSASGDAVAESDYWSDWSMQNYAWEGEVFIDWWGS